MSSHSNTSLVGKKTLALQIQLYLEMIRFSHTIFALPFAILAAVWAVVTPSSLPHSASSVQRWIGILLCMVLARSFAMAINRWADANVDALNPRTSQRHIPSGSLNSRQVLGFAIGCGVFFVLSCCLFLPNWLPLLASLPTLAFLAGYSFAKRFTSTVHFWLGAALMLSPICTWIALRGEVVQGVWNDLLPAFWLGLAIWFWVSGFDIIYACQDEAFDRQTGLHSIPVRLGIPRALNLAALCHAVMVVLLLTLPWMCPDVSLGPLWMVTIGVIGLLLVYEHALVSAQDLSKVNVAFFNVNALIGTAVGLLGSLDSLWR